MGCFTGAFGTTNRFEQTLGSDGYWDFYFQGCNGTESVALYDPAGGRVGDAFKSPTGYKCQLTIDGTSDGTAYHTDQIGAVADTGGLVIINRSSAWPGSAGWTINCIDAA